MTFANSCPASAADACAFHAEPVTLAEATQRFEREAQRGTCDTGNYRCPYFVWGQGPALVCVPGLADDARAFLLPLAHLSRHFRCVAYDWPTGRGDGACRGGLGHGEFVDDLLALLDHVGAARAFPMGYSFGSTVVLAALQAQPDRFPRAVLLHGFARRRLAPAERLLACWARYWPGPLRLLPLRDWVLQTTQRAAFARQAPEIWDYYLGRTGAMPMAALARRALLLDHLDLRAMLPGIAQQTLLVCGEADPMVSKQCEAELLLGLPNVARIEVANCGHMAIYTHPEVLAELVAEFLLS